MNIPLLDEMMSDLKKFACISPRLPRDEEKNFTDTLQIDLPDARATNRKEIQEYLRSMRGTSLFADLAFYTGRYCTGTEWPYFLKAAIERNPVALEYFRGNDIGSVYSTLNSMGNESIYGEGQFAQPDEVVNFERGDGLEKAITLADVMIDRDKDEEIEIRNEGNAVILDSQHEEYRFCTMKQVEGKFILKYGGYRYFE